MAKYFLLTLAAVFVGIAIWSRMSMRKPAPGTQYQDSNGVPLFAGPDVDPTTGAYLPNGARGGTVQFSAQR